MAEESQLDLIDRHELLKKKTEMDLCFAVSEFDINNAPRIMVPHWISVANQLPKSGERVIVCRKDGRVEQGVYIGVNGWWKVYGTNTKSITHWMPMPAPPEEV